MINDEEYVEIDLARDGSVLPQKKNKIALIDADTLVFAACTVLEVQDDLLPREMYTDEEWGELVTEPYFDEEKHCVFYTNLDDAKQHVEDRIQDILQMTGCKDYELHFTSKRESFRYKLIDKMYKSTRDSRAPAGIIELRELFVSEGKATIHTKWEADDIVVALKRDNPDKYIMCAVDKDLLYSLPGRHFNYYKSEKYNIPMKWLEVSKEEAQKHHYIQTLTGDPTDNVPGIRGIGPKKADKLLKDATTYGEMWDIVVKTYEKHNLTVIDAITTMRLVSMHQLVKNKDGEYELELWRPQV